LSHPCPADGCDRPAPGSQTICGACEADLRRALDSVAWLAGELDVTLSRQNTRTGTGTSEPEDDTTPAVLHIGPLPYDPRAAEVMYVLRSTLVGWTRIMQEGVATREGPWCADCEHPSCRLVPYSQGPGDTCESMAAWLSASLGRLVRHPAAQEAHGEILEAVRAVQRAVDSPPGHVYAGPCEECGAPLYAKPGAEWVRCREAGCDGEHEVAERRAWMLDAITGMLAPAHQVAYILSLLVAPLKPEAVRKWAERGRLVPHSADASGRPLYRVGDASELLTEKLQREEAARQKREAKRERMVS
jgi:hypothetical protein